LSATAGLEYLYPVFRQMDVGVGVLHDFSRSYEKVQTSATGGYTQIRIENFTNTAPYVVGRYHFQTVSVLEPYFIGRLGYSFNKFDYNKYNNETTMVGVSASDIKNRLCAALGMGSTLSRHLLAELTYDVLWTGHDKPAYNGDSEEFSTTLQGIRLNVGYNF
jgi:opacity protein-like surface antigen